MTSQQNDAILFDVDPQGIATLQVNRRHARNALNRDAQDRFAACIEKARSDKSVRALIITGSGDDAFVSGGDLKEILHRTNPLCTKLWRVITTRYTLH